MLCCAPLRWVGLVRWEGGACNEAQIWIRHPAAVPLSGQVKVRRTKRPTHQICNTWWYDFQGQGRAGWETGHQLSWKWHNFYFFSRLNCILLPEKYATPWCVGEPSKLVISLIFFLFSNLKLFLGYLLKSVRKGNDARYGLLLPLYLQFFLYSRRRSIFQKN